MVRRERNHLGIVVRSSHVFLFIPYMHTLSYEIHLVSWNYTYVVWFEVFRDFLKKATVFWCVNASQLVICYFCCGGACCPHL